MGWWFPHECGSKAQLRDHILAELSTDGDISTRRVLAHRTVGNHLWVAYQCAHKNPEHRPLQAILLYLIAKKDGLWGYKDMDESMEPYFYDCPESLLALFPPPNENAKRWRASVRDHHEAKRSKRSLFKRVKVGSVVTLTGCSPSRFRVAGLAPFQGYAVTDGRLYRLKKSRVTDVREEKCG